MAQTRDIRRRITSVKNTAQITKAMQLISASKMQKAQERALKSLPYAQGLREIVAKIGKVREYTSIYLKQPETVKNIAIVVIGTSRGFVGSMLSSLIIKTSDLVRSLKENYPVAEIRGTSIHKTGLRILANAGIKSTYHFADYVEAPTSTNLTAIFNLLTEKYGLGEFDEIYLVYTHFINTLKQIAVSKKLLPLELEEVLETKAGFDDSQQTATAQINQEQGIYIYEPSVAGILDKILPEYLLTQIFTGLLESIASEHSARMVAMKNATDNARELEKILQLQYNRKRQAGITQEIIRWLAVRLL